MFNHEIMNSNNETPLSEINSLHLFVLIYILKQ